MRLTLEHRVSLVDLRAHLIEVETTVRSDHRLPTPLTLFMPVWTPGSYLVREYARHVEGLSATVDGAATPMLKVRKNAWSCTASDARAVTVRYRAYCNDLTVRTNHVDATHAFLTGAATFLAVEGHESAPCTVAIDAPDGWRVATSLPEVSARDGRPTFEATDLDTLVDAPFEIGTHRTLAFEAASVPHRLTIVPASAASDAEAERVASHVRAIVETEAKLLGGPLPYPRYLVQLHLSARGRGGLEHMDGCTLLASSDVFATRDAYLDFLSLIAHEVLHAWNVKRIRPAGLTPYRYEQENYTRSLWWFEGATSYFDWRVLRLADLCTVSEYLGHLADEIAYLDATHGRLVSSLEEASFDAWIKLYRPDENSANSTVSYYRKGEVVCALLDLELRARSRGRASLDDVLRFLWEHYGANGVPVPEGGFPAIFAQATDTCVDDLLEVWVSAPGEIAYPSTLARAGLTLERHARPDAPRCSLGMRLRVDGSGRTMVSTVARGAAAQRAGIDPGDEIVAVAGHRLDGSSVDAALHGRAAGERVEVTIARDGRLTTRAALLDGPRLDRVRLVAKADASPEERALRRAWLRGEHPGWENT